MANLNGFDANDFPQTPDYGPIPGGKYVAAIVASEMRPNRAETGSYLQLTLEIIEGEHKGRRLWARLNLDNPSEIAQKIARAELAAICRAVGVLAPKDSEELHNLPLVINVKCKKRNDSDEIVNVVSGYSSRFSQKPSPAQPISSRPPWASQR